MDDKHGVNLLTAPPLMGVPIFYLALLLTASCKATAGISEFCRCIAAASQPIGSISFTPYSSVGT